MPFTRWKDIFIVKIRRFLGFIIFTIVDFIATKKTNPIIPQTLLLVRVDVLGDYILFRNFIKVLKESDKYRNYKITFCGNQSLRELVEFLDGEYIDDFIWIDREKLVLNISYRYKTLKYINSRGFEIAINPQYSREFFHSDAIVRATNARYRIGFDGDLNNMDKWQKRISNRYYTNLVEAEDSVLFEFYRNKNFFESILGMKLDIKKPYIEIKNSDNKSHKATNNYVVICPGARTKFRQWSPERFAKISDFITSHYRLDILIVGTKSEQKITERVLLNVESKEKIVDLTGKLDFHQFIGIIAKAKLVITNDTGTAHVSAALNTNTLVISNGNHFGRFIPYPDEISANLVAVFPAVIESNRKNRNYLEEKYKYYSDIDINTISINDVERAISEILNNA